MEQASGKQVTIQDLRPVGRHELLKQLPGVLTLIDSTIIDTLCTVASSSPDTPT